MIPHFANLLRPKAATSILKIYGSNLAILVGMACPPAGQAATRYAVPTGGVAAGTGSAVAPWTLQHALNSATAGDVIYLRDRGKDGLAAPYRGRHVVGASGTTAARISLLAYPGESPAVDGTGAVLPGDGDYLGLLHFASRSNWTISGIEFRNYATANTNSVLGIAILGTCQNITIQKCKVHHITATLRGAYPGNANGIGVYGTSGSVPISNIAVDGCEIYSLITGYSESVTFNGNVQGFSFTNNIVRDCNNIGVDVIGFEGTAPANDQARSGVIRGNEIYRIDSKTNPAYGGYRAAGGIYVDGGKDVVIEANRVHLCNFGIELGAEAAGKYVSNCAVRNNWVYHCHSHGILLGGSEVVNGGCQNTEVSNNTLFRNGGAGIALQNKVTGTVARNNILWSGSSECYVQQFATGSNNKFNYNCYFSDAAAANKSRSKWTWQGRHIAGVDAWKAASGNDANSTLGNPQFMNTVVTAANAADLHLKATSVAINVGDPATVVAGNATDISGDARILSGRVDIGADEFKPLKVALRPLGLQTTQEFGTVSTRLGVFRSGNTTTPLTVTLTYAGTATNGVDYVRLPTSVTIPAGAAETVLELKPIRDRLVEGGESVQINVGFSSLYEPGTTASLLFQISDLPVDAWRKVQFGANVGNLAISSPQADPDRDGMNNATEYAIGSNPTVADRQLLPQATLQNGYLTMIVRRNPNARDADLCPEVSTKTVGPWIYGSNYVTLYQDSPNYFRAVDKVPAGAAGSRFMRLRVCLQ